jgi:hypothetical protein
MHPRLRLVLRIAAIYNLLWGAWVVLWPQHFFQLVGMPAINHPMVWQGMGMVIGVYGLGYWWASRDYVRHWPIVMVGMLGKVFGPLGYVGNLLFLDMPHPEFGYMLLLNDLPWWPFFALMLLEAWRVHRFKA